MDLADVQAVLIHFPQVCFILFDELSITHQSLIFYEM